MKKTFMLTIILVSILAVLVVLRKTAIGRGMPGIFEDVWG